MKSTKKISRKENGYARTHKEPIPAAHENKRYTGPCRGDVGCEHCKATITTMTEVRR